MRVEARNLDKHFGKTHAVSDLSFTLEPGRITGFLGPNGSGKSSTMRLMLGLDRGQGETLYDGKKLTEHRQVSKVVGAHLDAKFFHPKRTAWAHLRMLGAESGVPKARIDEVLHLVGLDSVAKKRPGGYSLGMGQRLGLAGAILANPDVLLLDEPANGLDPQSIQWMRDFLRFYANQGKTVFVSSHLLSEMQLMADDVLVIAQGKLIAQESLDNFIAQSTQSHVLVRTPDIDKLQAVLRAQGIDAQTANHGLLVNAVTSDRVGEIAFTHNVQLAELTVVQPSLEEVFLDMTTGSQQYAVGEPVASDVQHSNEGGQ